MTKYVAGIDVGSRTTRCIILDEDEQIVATSEVQTGAFLSQAAEDALTLALSQSRIPRDDVGYVSSTGWGRYQVPFRQIQITDITCHARGAVHLFPNTRTVLDIGAQNTRAIRIDPSGRVRTFRMNNRCAAGAGRFLERTAMALEIPLEQIGSLALRGVEPETISSICAVMAESEVINLVSHEARLENILAGVHNGLVERIVSLVRQVGAEPELTLTGGVARNVGMVKALRDYLGMELNISPMSEFAGALGASLLGWTRVRRRSWTMTTKDIRSLTLEDAESIASIEKRLGTPSCDIQGWRERLGRYIESGEPALGVVREGRLVGYILGFVRGGEFGLRDRVGWIEFLGIDPEYQRSGLGRTLIQNLLSYFKRRRVNIVMTLVQEHQADLHGFFLTLGFQPASVKTLIMPFANQTTENHPTAKSSV